MGKLRSGSVRERPAIYFAQISFTDEKGKSQKLERQAESQKQAKQLLTQIVSELKKRKEVSVTGQRIRERQGGTPKPSDIALEHAARLCGTLDYQYAIATLWGLLQKQKSAMAKNEEIEHSKNTSGR